MAEVLDGKQVAETIRNEVGEQVAALAAAGLRPPGLAVILVGGNPASSVYVGSKARACAELGIVSIRHDLSDSVSNEQLLALLDELNADDSVDGILVQLPLPKHIDSERVLEAIRPDKDVDGFHPMNAGRLFLGQEERTMAPCTPIGIIELLDRSGVEIAGARAVIVGRSAIVGKPLAALLINRSATVTVCHSRTRDLSAVCREADILVAAIGRAAFITDAHVRPGATVVDVGINAVTDAARCRELFGEDPKRLETLARRGQTLVGDVHPRLVAPVAGRLTPVPGGVGPMTIAMLMSNTLRAYRLRTAAAC